MQFYEAVLQGEAPKNPKEKKYTRYCFADTIITEDDETMIIYRAVTDDSIILDDRFYDFVPVEVSVVKEAYNNEDVDELLASLE